MEDLDHDCPEDEGVAEGLVGMETLDRDGFGPNVVVLENVDAADHVEMGDVVAVVADED